MMRGGSLQDPQGILGDKTVTLALRCSRPAKKHKRKPETCYRLKLARFFDSEKKPVTEQIDSVGRGERI
jgi:hypothetical protein